MLRPALLCLVACVLIAPAAAGEAPDINTLAGDAVRTKRALKQVQDEMESVIAYGSGTLTKEEQRYCVIRREMLATLHFLKQYWHYLLVRSKVLYQAQPWCVALDDELQGPSRSSGTVAGVIGHLQL